MRYGTVVWSFKQITKRFQLFSFISLEMGSFEFGIASSLDPNISLYCFLSVVCFIIFFDYISSLVEFFLEKSPLYNRMLQLIYKELMLMGLVSFSVIMYEATNLTQEGATIDSSTTSAIRRFLSSSSSSESVSTDHKILVSIDFAHILIFYITLFFVLHAFFLMVISIVNEIKYYKYSSDDFNELISRIETLQKFKNQRYFYESSYWPFSFLRHRIEYHLLKDIFHDMFLLSEQFDFAAYLSMSYGRYAVKTMNRSLLTWFFFLLILVINYCRIASGHSCYGHDRHANNVKDSLFGQNINCNDYNIRVFIFSGIILSLYFLVLLYISHIYKERYEFSD
jgi:hypothetical protein